MEATKVRSSLYTLVVGEKARQDECNMYMGTVHHEIVVADTWLHLLVDTPEKVESR
jgi:hypothetical protein